MRPALFPILLAATLTGCAQRPEPIVDQAWARLPAVPGRPAAAYATITGGAADATLIAASSPSARRTELHESYPGGMRAVGALPVAAGRTVRLAPGGYHVMLFDIDPRLAPGGTLTLRLSFADGRTVETPARLVAPADPAP